jgi:hypothetical protein
MCFTSLRGNGRKPDRIRIRKADRAFFLFTLAGFSARLSGRMGNPSLSFLLAKETWCRRKESNLHDLAVTGF